MGKLDPSLLRYLTRDDIETLLALERGMRNHELVAEPVVASLAHIKPKRVHAKLRELTPRKLMAYERGKKYDGYRLTNKGYDYLALKSLTSKGHIEGFGNQIGVGKESDIYKMNGPTGLCCMKVHRLGRTSFRNIKHKRDYLGHRTHANWLNMSRLSASKEFQFMTVLHEHGFPVPIPIASNRHIVIMSLIHGYPLCHATEVVDPGQLFNELMDLITKLASHGVIHCDFNEFNIMINYDTHKPILIDFPQMVSVDHPNAESYFNRDVMCVVDLFKRKFNFRPDKWPVFGVDTKRVGNIDQLVKASGREKDIKEFDRLYPSLLEEAQTFSQEESSDFDDSESDDEDASLHSSEAEEENAVSELDHEDENLSETQSDSSTVSTSPDKVTELFQKLRLHMENPEKEDKLSISLDGINMKNLSDTQVRELRTAYLEGHVTLNKDSASQIQDPADMQQRLLREQKSKQKKQRSKKWKRVKGEASAHNRLKKTLDQTIKEMF